MYRYDAFDAGRLSGALTEEEFKPIGLMNGVYLQPRAYMLRIAIPTAP
jgi:sulfite reductase (NADPH) hemoprotein beta-component